MGVASFDNFVSLSPQGLDDMSMSSHKMHCIKKNSWNKGFAGASNVPKPKQQWRVFSLVDLYLYKPASKTASHIFKILKDRSQG